MKAVVEDRAGDLEVAELPTPELMPGLLAEPDQCKVMVVPG